MTSTLSRWARGAAAALTLGLAVGTLTPEPAAAAFHPGHHGGGHFARHHGGHAHVRRTFVRRAYAPRYRMYGHARVYRPHRIYRPYRVYRPYRPVHYYPVYRPRRIYRAYPVYRPYPVYGYGCTLRSRMVFGPFDHGYRFGWHRVVRRVCY